MKKVVLITGATSGIGNATVKELLKRKSFIVYATGREKSVLKDLEQLGAITIVLDVTDEKSIVEAVSKIKVKEKRIDVLINNAGYGSYGAVEDVPLSEARKQFEVNLFSIARLLQEVLPIMRKQKSGTIVNMSSMGGKIYTPLGAWYHATKHAVEGFSDCLRIELAPFGIRVIIIEPGIIKTQFNTVAIEHMEKTSMNSVYKKFAEANIAAFKKSDKRATDPVVVAKAIADALEEENPKTRYAVPFNSKLYIFLRKILPDRWFDFILVKSINMPQKV